MRKNVNPSVWGQTGWTFLKHCAQACDDESFPRYLEFLHLLPEVLPCEKCRKHARDYLSAHPPKPGESLTAWIEGFEASVRQRKAAQAAEDAASSRRSGEERLMRWSSWALVGFVLLVLVLLLCLTSLLLCAMGRRPA